jgi:hypothetical protein
MTERAREHGYPDESEPVTHPHEDLVEGTKLAEHVSLPAPEEVVKGFVTPMIAWLIPHSGLDPSASALSGIEHDRAIEEQLLSHQLDEIKEPSSKLLL